MSCRPRTVDPRRPLVLLTLMLLLACVVVPSPSLAQDDAAPAEPTTETPPAPPPAPPPQMVPQGLRSPRATMMTFLEAMANKDNEQAASTLDLGDVREEAAPLLTWKLLEVLDRLGEVKAYELPSFEMLETWPEYQGVTSYTYFPDLRVHDWVFEDADPEGRIVIARQDDGVWRFSDRTVEQIDGLYRSLSHLRRRYGADRGFTLYAFIREGVPAVLRDNVFLTLEYWQWIALAVLIAVGVILDHIVRFILVLISRRVIARQQGEASDTTLRNTVRPFGLFAAALLWFWTLEPLGLTVQALNVLGPAVKLFAMLATVWAAFRLTDLIGEVFASKAASTDSKFDDLLVPLVRKTVKIFIAVFGLIYIADSFQVEIAPLLTGLGIGGVGFAFAAKDTLENFFGSVTVIVDRPFQVGDWITIGDVEGTVEELGLRSVRIRTFYNSLVTVPTANLVRASVDNYGARKYRRWTTHLNVTYDTPPESIDAFCEGIRELIRLHPYTRKDYYQVWLHKFGTHSLDLLVYLFFEAPEWQTELRERHRMMLDIIRLADALGVQLAFPTQTLHVEQMSPDAVHEAAAPPEGGTDFRAQREGRKAVHELTKNAGWRTSKPGPYRFRALSPDDDDDDTQIESKVGGDA